MVKLNISLLIFLLFFLLFTSSHVRGATISGPSFPFEANIGDEITIQMESDASSIDRLEFKPDMGTEEINLGAAIGI